MEDFEGLTKKQLIEGLSDKEFRDRFASYTLHKGVADQVKFMREKKGWTKNQLSTITGLSRKRIDLYEDPNYHGMQIHILKIFAKVFDVALTIRFIRFSELIDWFVVITKKEFVIMDLKNDKNIHSG